MIKVLLIEDNANDAELFKRLLQTEGCHVETASTATRGLRRAQSSDFDVVLTDLYLGGARKDEGRQVVTQLHARDPHLPVILMTGSHTAHAAIDVIKLGAFDYFSKPLDPFDESFRVELADMVENAASSRRLMAEVKLEDESDAEAKATTERIVGKSRAMQEIYKEVGRVAATPATVLIRGETGTGKELVARAIYTYSQRNRQPFVVVNCAAIPEQLLESELFGHEQGAFTGATTRRIGRFEQANGGTIFLDEIGDMGLKLQQKLLRVLQEKTIERVGGTESVPVDVRVLAATHRDLERAIHGGEFRQDLYFRLNVAVISLPALRARAEDVPELVRYFLRRHGSELGSVIPVVTPDALQKLQEHSWPGNVRELRNVIRKALLLARGYVIEQETVLEALDQMRPPRLTAQEPFAKYVTKVLASAKTGEGENVFAELADVAERELYTQAIRRAGGEQLKVARWLGVSRPTVREKLIRFDLLPVRNKSD